MLGHRGGEQVLPRPDIRAATQQRTTLALGQTTPDAELDFIVECIGEAFGADWAPPAH